MWKFAHERDCARLFISRMSNTCPNVSAEARRVMAYVVMAYVVMAYVVMAYVIMAYVGMAELTPA